MNSNKSEILKRAILLLILIIAFGIVLSIMIKYTQEGETNMPFNLSEIIVVSSAEGIDKAENPDNNKWNLDIMQYNDIYLYEPVVLHIGLICENIDVINILIDFGADIYAEDSSGENILMLAEKINNEEIINIITKEYENGF